jgi:hypothetical protein
MTNKVAFMNENDNDSHLDLQVVFQINLFIDLERSIIAF